MAPEGLWNAPRLTKPDGKPAENAKSAAERFPPLSHGLLGKRKSGRVFSTATLEKSTQTSTFPHVPQARRPDSSDASRDDRAANPVADAPPDPAWNVGEKVIYRSVAKGFILTREANLLYSKNMTVKIDTLSIVDRLKAAGASQKLARETAEILAEDADSNVTKSDPHNEIQKLELRLKNFVMIQSFAIVGVLAAIRYFG